MNGQPEASVLSPLQLKAESDPQFAETMWRLRHPEEGGEKHTYERILAEDLPELGVGCGSLDTLSRFYSWLRLRRQFQADRDFVRQFEDELRKDGTIPEEEIERRGRILFMSRSIAKEDPKVFAVMHRLGTNTKTARQRDKQLEQKDAEIAQRDEMIAQAGKKLELLEARERRRVEAEEAIRKLQSDRTMSEEEQRAAVIAKMDEFFGVKKAV